jgi:hypothetical protein
VFDFVDDGCVSRLQAVQAFESPALPATEVRYCEIRSLFDISPALDSRAERICEDDVVTVGVQTFEVLGVASGEGVQCVVVLGEDGVEVHGLPPAGILGNASILGLWRMDEPAGT